MSWFLGEDPRAASRATQVKDLKKAFVSLVEVKNGSKNSFDESIFELLFESSRQFCTLRIFLDKEFPKNKPVLQVFGNITHPWLDHHNRVVGCEKLNNWSKSSSLTDVVQECFLQLQRASNHPNYSSSPSLSLSPPPPSSASLPPPPAYSSLYHPTTHHSTPTSSTPTPPISGMGGSSGLSLSLSLSQSRLASESQSQSQSASGGTSNHPHSAGRIPTHHGTTYYLPQSTPPPPLPSSSSSLPGMTGSGTGTGTQRVSPGLPLPLPLPPSITHTMTSTPSRTPLPAVPVEFPELESLSIDRLRQLQADTVAVKAHVKHHKSSVQFMKQKENIIRENVQRAKDNMSKYELYQVEREEVISLQLQLKQKLEEYNKRVSAIGDMRESSDLREQLSQRKHYLNTESERQEKAYQEGVLQMNEFIKSYLEVRTKYHTVDIKLKTTRNFL